MIHYHGTPLTPRRELEKLAGEHFCVSYATPQDADWCLKNAQSVMWDNGAFTSFTKGKPFDKGGYIRWLEPRLGHPHWAVVPDVIGGDVKEQRTMLSDWPYPRTLSAPVWHLGLPIDYLLELCDEWPKVCFGSSAQYWKVGAIDWRRRVDLAFDALSRRHRHLPWIHMLRGLAQAGKRWPFASADSVNVARNFKNKGKEQCPLQMARRINAAQTPITFNREDSLCDLQPSYLSSLFLPQSRPPTG
jgi:hypothetical protein